MGKQAKINNTRGWLIGCGLVGGLGIFILVVGAVMAAFLIPDASTQMPPGINPIFVNLNMPLNGESLPLNQPVSVYAEAFGDQPIDGIELLVDGVLLPGGSSTPAGANKVIVSWAFTPDKEGMITLVARANAQDGQVGISNAVNVNVVPLEQIPLPVVQGVSTAPLVISDEADPAEPEGGTPASPPPGFNDQGGVGNPPPPPPQPTSQESPPEPEQQPGDNVISVDYILWLQTIFKKFVDIEKPLKPTLDGGANQCGAVLVVTDNAADEAGFFLYRLDPGKQAFSRVATLDGKAGKAVFSYHDPGLASGKYMYFISSFNAGGESASNIISITIDAPGCAAAKKPTFESLSIPIPPGQPLDKAYCYGSADGMPWVRLPSGQDNFILPVNGKFDLAPYWGLIPLPQQPPPQVTLNMECWGWNGSALVFLGSSSQTINGGIGPTQAPGPPSPGDEKKPQKPLIASPYNAAITNDPNVCKDHVFYQSDEAQCKETLSFYRNLLVWTWNRYGNCNPGSEYCDMSYQPKDRFNYFVIKDGKTADAAPINGLVPLDGNTYVPLRVEGEYFVRAVSDTYGESGDSNHVIFTPTTSETILKPTAVETWRWTEKNYGGITPHWETTTGASPPDGLISGYTFTCLNNCSEGQFSDSRYNGRIKFTLPDNKSVKNAQLSWKNNWYTTDGAGANDVIMSCGVSLHAETTGSVSMKLSNFSLWGSENYNVYLPVLMTIMDGDKNIEFLFVAPIGKTPGVRWNRCLWFINNLSLTLKYYE
jgi:hypothetical protein